MDWLQFSAAIVSAIAWPITVVILAVLLRSPLAKLIPMVRSLKYKDLHIDLSEKLEAVKGELDAHSSQDGQPSYVTASPSVLELARIDPRAAVFGAWVDVERAMTEMATKAGVSLTGSPVSIASELHAIGALNEFELQTFRDLRRIRNDAVHLTAKDVSYDEAASMAEMCQWMAHRIRMLTDGVPAVPHEG